MRCWSAHSFYKPSQVQCWLYYYWFKQRHIIINHCCGLGCEITFFSSLKISIITFYITQFPHFTWDLFLSIFICLSVHVNLHIYVFPFSFKFNSQKGHENILSNARTSRNTTITRRTIVRVRVTLSCPALNYPGVQLSSVGIPVQRGLNGKYI